MGHIHDELHHMVDELSEDQVANVLSYATYVRGQNLESDAPGEDLAVWFWRVEESTDWDGELIDLGSPCLR